MHPAEVSSTSSAAVSSVAKSLNARTADSEQLCCAVARQVKNAATRSVSRAVA